MSDDRESPLLLTAQALLSGLLAEKRGKAGLTLRQVAVQLNRSKSWVWRTETGARKLNVDEFIALAKLYGADPGDLLSQAAEILKLPPEH